MVQTDLPSVRLVVTDTQHGHSEPSVSLCSFSFVLWEALVILDESPRISSSILTILCFLKIILSAFGLHQVSGCTLTTSFSVLPWHSLILTYQNLENTLNSHRSGKKMGKAPIHKELQASKEWWRLEKWSSPGKNIRIDYLIPNGSEDIHTNNIIQTA